MSYLEELSDTIDALDMMQLFALLNFVRDCQGTLWLAGNGGSASIAQHWACDLSKAAGRRVQALGSNPAVLTAWSNDTHYANALTSELAAIARGDDALILLSCSGRSGNIVQLITFARAASIPCYLIAGQGAPSYPGITMLGIPHDNYGIIEDCFSAIGHWLTEELQK